MFGRVRREYNTASICPWPRLALYLQAVSLHHTKMLPAAQGLLTMLHPGSMSVLTYCWLHPWLPAALLCVCLVCRDGCTHVLALCSRPYTTGPAWGKYLSRTLHNAIKYWLLNPVSKPDSSNQHTPTLCTPMLHTSCTYGAPDCCALCRIAWHGSASRCITWIACRP